MDVQLKNFAEENSVRGDNVGNILTPRRDNCSPAFKADPTNIHWGNMKNDTLTEKERLLKKWTFS